MLHLFHLSQDSSNYGKLNQGIFVSNSRLLGETSVLEPIDPLVALRKEIDKINLQILELLCERGGIVQRIADIHSKREDEFFHPEREREMLAEMVSHNRGPYSDETIVHLFTEIFRASLDLEEQLHRQHLLCHRSQSTQSKVIQIQNAALGNGDFTVIAGPCSIESMTQLEKVAEFFSQHNLQFMRGGAYKPRTSPYSFQGLGEEGLRFLHDIGQRFGFVTVSEIMDIRDLDLFCQHIDIIQIGMRNMSNTPLLKAVGQTDKTILLKRGMMSTIEEFLFAAEYVMLQGNDNLILCERGIRTFEPWTRNTLDLSAVALLKQETYLPVMVDISHAAGRRDILIPLARAAKAVGADGLMVEVHPNPALARSDNKQQLNFEQFERLLASV